MGNFANAKNKFCYVYVLTPRGISEKAAITQRFLQRKMEEYEVLKSEIAALKPEVREPARGDAQQAQEKQVSSCAPMPSLRSFWPASVMSAQQELPFCGSGFLMPGRSVR
jgi:hypothetical protein